MASEEDEHENDTRLIMASEADWAEESIGKYVSW